MESAPRLSAKLSSLGIAVTLALAGTAHAGLPVGTAFSYQGQLSLSGGPANGVYDLQFDLYDAASGGAQIGPAVFIDDLVVSNGLLTLELDFGEVFFGDAIWLEIAVRDGVSTGSYTTLSPRQPLFPSPFAGWARSASWGGLTDVPAGFADDIDDDVVGDLSCADGEIAVQGTGGAWQCGAVGTGDITEVSAGLGLTGGGTSGGVTLDVNFDGSGTSPGVAHGDHDHLGQNWTGSGGLEINTNTATAFTGLSIEGEGVVGGTSGYSGVGVFGVGYSPNGNETNFGVKGAVISPHGRAVHGQAYATSGTNYGIIGQTNSPDGYAGFFVGGRNYFQGPVGIGYQSPQTKLHIRQDNLGMSSSPFGSDDVVVESTEAVVGLYSAAGGIWGSNIALGEVDGSGDLEDIWNIRRRASDWSDGPDLHFSYGLNATEGPNQPHLVLSSDGRVGIGDQNPQTKLHIRQEDLGLPSSPFGSDDIVIESTEAVVGLYSTGGDTWGSGIALGEVNGSGGLEDMWNIRRQASDASTGPDLRFSYGPGATDGGNSTYFVLGSNGRVGVNQVFPAATLEVLAPAAEDGFRVRIDGGTKFLVKENGYVAVGGNFTPSFQLQVGGDGTAGKPGGGSWSNSSDRRLKKNIRPLDGALNLLTALRGVTYEYIDPDSINELPGIRVGMVAQEVEVVVPDWVSTGPTGYKRLTYRGFEALTVEAFRELRDERDALEQRVAALETLVERLIFESPADPLTEEKRTTR